MAWKETEKKFSWIKKTIEKSSKIIGLKLSNNEQQRLINKIFITNGTSWDKKANGGVEITYKKFYLTPEQHAYESKIWKQLGEIRNITLKDKFE